MADEPVQVTAAHLRIIHAALIAGVLLFAAVIAVVVPSGSPEPMNALRLAWLGAAAAAMVAAGVVSGRLAVQADSASRARSAIIMWAIGEGPALLGLAFSFVTGDRLLLVLPVVVFLLYMMRYRPVSFTSVR
ncbi:MAG: hypothetical protein ABFS14_08085 [Gemmatimonadota bacterium]